jgi:poly(A) polymerase
LYNCSYFVKTKNEKADFVRIRYGTTQDGRPIKKAIVYTKDEHTIKIDAVDKDAVYIVERLRANGYETYIVGGAVRDLILGKHPKDFDIVSAASPARIKKIFRNSRIIGRRFRLVHVYFGPKIFEVSTFRSLKDGPTSNTYGSIEEDVLRRDFSVNAIFYDPLKEIVVDYVGGMKDIREKRIRPIIPISMIFQDDPVRMIRAVKYAATTSFKLPWRLAWKIRRQAPLLSEISPSRLTEEILKIIHSSDSARIIENLETFGLYGYLQPEASALMRRDPSFRTRYLKGFADIALKPETARAQGETMTALIRDFLEETIDWEGGIIENYKNAFLEARRFVLPMNPPRADLDHAVRLIFSEHGLTVKKSRLLLPHARQADSRLAGAEENPAVPHAPVPEGEPKKRRSRGKRRGSSAGKTTGADRELAASPGE